MNKIKDYLYKEYSENLNLKLYFAINTIFLLYPRQIVLLF